MIQNDPIIQSYVFFQEFSQFPDFKNKSASVLSRTTSDKFELIIPFEDFGRIPDEERVIQELNAWEKELFDREITVPSCYANMTLHREQVRTFRSKYEKILNHAKKLFPDFNYLSVNAIPLDWNNYEIQKSDEQLRNQIEEIKVLQDILSDLAITLCYHFHTSELYKDGKEFYSVIEHTDSKKLKLNLDANWLLFSNVSIEEFIKKFKERIGIVHLRASTDGYWLPALEEGDEKNSWILKQLSGLSLEIPLVIELANSPGKNYKSTLAERLIQSEKWLSETIAKLG